MNWFVVALIMVVGNVQAQEHPFPQARASGEILWPEEKWPAATPESQGMSREKLSSIPYDALKLLGTAIVIRNGYDVWHYGDPYGSERGWASCLRSYTTTIFGMLIYSGEIAGGKSALEMKVKLKHLLSYIWTGKDQYTGEGDRTPGTQWNYGDGYEKMEGIITAITGKRSWEYINDELQPVLGGEWRVAPVDRGEGVDPGQWLDILANVADAARWGYFWMNGGQWNGTRLVDKWFVDTTIQPFPSPYGGYASIDEGWQIHINKGGHHWIGLPEDSYAATGGSRHTIFVCPSLDLVIASSCSGKYQDNHKIEEFILPVMEAVLRVQDSCSEK